MPRKAYGGVENVSKNGIKIYGGVNNLSKNIIAGYVGVNGVSKRFWPPGNTPIYQTKLLFKDGEFYNVPEDLDLLDYVVFVKEKWETVYRNFIRYYNKSDADNVIWIHGANLFEIDPTIHWRVKDIKIDSKYDVDIVDPYLKNEILFRTNIRYVNNRDDLYCRIKYYGNIKVTLYQLDYVGGVYSPVGRNRITLNSPDDEVAEVEFQLSNKDYYGRNYDIDYIGIDAAMNDSFTSSMNQWIADNIGGSGTFGVSKAYAQYGYPKSSGGWEVREFQVERTSQVTTVFSICFFGDYPYNDYRHNLMVLISRGPFDVDITEYRNGQVYNVDSDSGEQKTYNGEIFYTYSYHPLPSSSWEPYWQDTWYPRNGWEVTNGVGFENKLTRFAYEFLNSIQKILWSQQIVEIAIVNKSRYG